MYQKGLAHLMAAVCGAVYIVVVAEVFGRILVPNPINQWLIESLARTGYEKQYTIAIYTHDSLIYLIVALPVAFALSHFRPKYGWRYVFTALGTSLALQYWPLIWEPSRLQEFAGHWQFYLGLGMSTLALPIAFAVVSCLGKTGGSAAEAATSSA